MDEKIQIKDIGIDNVKIVEVPERWTPLMRALFNLGYNFDNINEWNNRVICKVLEMHVEHGIKDIDTVLEWLSFVDLETANIQWDDLIVKGSQEHVELATDWNLVSVWREEP